MSVPAASCWLVVRAATQSEDELARVVPGDVVRNLREDTSYTLEVEGAGSCHLYIDEIPLTRLANGLFVWAPSFFAGQVEAVAVGASGSEHLFYLEVVPADEKVSGGQYEAMLAEIRQFDVSLLLGETPACIGFGRYGNGGKFDMLVRWERLKRHGAAFLEAVGKIVHLPHHTLRPVSQLLPLQRVRRLPPSALRDRRVVSLAMGRPLGVESIESVQIQVQVPAATVDTPANRAVFALLLRFRHALFSLQSWVDAAPNEAAEGMEVERRLRRRQIIALFAGAVERLLKSFPFMGVRRAETTAAGLTQIAAHPVYARAYRRGTEALRLGVEGDSFMELLRVSPSWGVYETWCFVSIHQLLAQALQVHFAPCESKIASSDLAVQAQLADGKHLEVLFQAVFPSEKASGGHLAWSVSRERRPDVIVVLRDSEQVRYVVLDAKYRSGRANVLDAMASAHIYHDSLYLGQQKPDMCLLLLPGLAAVQSLERKETWHEYGVGSISRFSLEGHGMKRCADAIKDWVGGGGIAEGPMAAFMAARKF